MWGRRWLVSNVIGWALLQALSGCGGKSSTEVPRAQRDTSAIFGSGTRLKAHYLDGGDGARVPVDFFDSELSTNCQFVESASGQYHCLPATRTRFYFDAACSEPAYVPSPCAQIPPPPELLVSANSPECDALASGYSLGEERPMSMLYIRTSEGCQADQARSAWWLVREPLARFVQGTTSVVGAEGGLQASRVTADDGAFLNLRLVTDGEPCSQVLDRGVPRCISGISARLSSALFDNANCDSAVAVRYLDDADRCAGRQAFVTERKSNNCVANDSVYAALDEVTAAIYQQQQSGECLALGDDAMPSSYFFYHAGAELSIEGAPRVNTVRVGSGALGLPCQTDREGVPLLAPNSQVPIPQIWQLESGRKCGAIADPSGTLRCVPYGLGLPTSPIPGELGPFSDADCTRRVETVSRDACSNEAVPNPYFIETDDALCKSTITHAYIATPYDGPFYEMRDTICRSAPNWRNQLTFVVGPEVDLSSFPPISDLTDQ
ncbi:MAG TPA: hypothetical protein VER96_31780 [Polyangiaceae bacterium]|nr:hypothetical protein [Polyangiaceae bacterium]